MQTYYRVLCLSFLMFVTNYSIIAQISLDSLKTNEITTNDYLPRGGNIRIIDRDTAFIEMPQFPGGDKALYNFVSQEIQYPRIAEKWGMEGKVYVQFIVTKEGNVTDVKVVQGIGKVCDDEAIRVTKLLPKWIPGKKGGKPVNVRISIPIVFKLQ